MSQLQEYHIAFGVDAKYVKYAGVMMTSLVLNNLGQPLCFHLACAGLTAEDKRKLDDFTRLYKNTRIFVYDAASMLRSIPTLEEDTPDRLNKTVFLRILLPMFLPKELERIIYLDADMLCVGAMDKLWNMDLEGKVLGAVLEGGYLAAGKRISLKQDKYFNAGMMIIDLKQWRARKMTQQVLELFKQHKKRFKMLEQDTLNYLLDGDFKLVPSEYVCLMDAFNPLSIKTKPENILYHFLNEGKPWIRYAEKNMAKLYWSYVGRSLWYDMPYEEPRDVKTAFLAGVNANKQGDYKEAAEYLEQSAQRLMEFYLEQTGKLK